MRGIYFDGKHSWHTFKAVISKSKKPVPSKKLCDETVPYANVIYDFSTLNGKQSYEPRILEYTLSFTAGSRRALLRKYDDIIHWLYGPQERIPLHDDEEPFIHYLAKCTAVSEPTYTGCVCQIKATFSAYPLRIPNRPSVVYTTATAPYPDVNLDGTVNSSDAALILQAAAAIGGGRDPGLTEEQLDRADANRDGSINASDAALVLSFSAACGGGKYTNNADGWVQFLNDQKARQEGYV